MSSANDNSQLWLLNNYLAHRWGCNYVANLMTQIPEDQTVLQQIVQPMTAHIRKLCEGLEGQARQANLTLPQTPPLASDYHKEAEISQDELLNTILPHLEEPAKKIIEYNRKTSRPQSEGGNHWSTNMKVLIATGDLFFDIMDSIKPQESNDAIAQYSQLTSADDWRKTTKAISDELEKCNFSEAEVGSKENLDGILNKNRELIHEYCSIATRQSV